ncbi:MAG: orotidine-5'-phosphate decarboxylase [Acidobacteria bacterium]|nr:orotidine-5'-phosphate decarboxylase [Acidobacteriota bacterium]
MAKDAHDRLIVALDYDRLVPAYEMASRLTGLAGMFKIGMQLFTAEGPRAVEKLAKLGAGIFLDLKFHDIPNTVAGAVAAAAELPGVRLVNVHALGGPEMMRAAARAVSGRKNRPKVLGVTLLTSMGEEMLGKLGILGPPEKRVVRLARLAKQAGLDGVVASPLEVAEIRRACRGKFITVVPGIRPARAEKNDQSRTATPAAAIRAGADYLVVGRPITAARNPHAAAKEFLEEMSEALA